ncbi:MAG: GNAT family N-acetyltransferase, partial [Planctomycetota bacterium]|nr:GNAT family N-acetyltransferase [Planctomycetota bacterium]
MMRFQVINPADLDHGLIERWADLQQANAALSSPYFRPEFTLAVGRVRSDARVTVIEDGGRVVGFLP